jgi:hypothetical protein
VVSGSGEHAVKKTAATFGWLMRNRRLSKDYERMVQSSETLIEVVIVSCLGG